MVLAHDDGTWTLYAHALNVWVRPGERVSEAQGIATVGRTCFTKAKPAHLCAGAHLHFEAARTRYPKRLDTKPADRGRFDPAVLFR